VSIPSRSVVVIPRSVCRVVGPHSAAAVRAAHSRALPTVYTDSRLGIARHPIQLPACKPRATAGNLSSAGIGKSPSARGKTRPTQGFIVDLARPTQTIMTVNDPSPRTVPWTAGSADGHARRVGGASRDQPRSSHDPEAPAQSRWQKEDPIPSESCRLHDFGCDNCLCAARRPVHSHRGFCTPRARSAARRRECRVMSLWSLVELALLRWHAHSYRFCRRRHATEDVDTKSSIGAGPLVITPKPNGPLKCAGPIKVSGVDGRIRESHDICLCRCGGSATKPFCDGTHTKIGFAG